MSYYGSWKIDDNLTFAVNTHTPSTGAATDADAVPAYRVYEDETATPIVTGNMALLDSANTAGFYSEQIALSAANGFEKGKSYNIYVSAAVGGTTGTISHDFQMEAEVDANIVSTGAIVAGSFAAGAIDAAAIATDAIGSAQIATDAIGAAELASDAVDEILDAFAIRRNTAQAGAAGTITLDASASATDDLYNGQLIRIRSATGADQTRLITDYNGTTKVATIEPNWITNPDATSVFVILAFGRVPAIANSGITTSSFTAGAIDAAAIAANAIGSSELATDAISSAQIAADAIGASELAADAVTEIRDAVTGGAYALDTDASGRVRIVDGVAAGEIDTASGRVQITEAQIDQVVDEVWDEAKVGHVGVGSFGEEMQAHSLSTEITALNDLSAAEVNTEVDNALNTAIPGAPTADSINERIVAIDDLTQAGGAGDLAAIIADTNELQGDWVDGGRLDLIVDAILVDTGNLNDTAISEIGGIGDVPATPTLRQAVMLVYMWLRNNSQATATERRILNNAGTEVLDATMSDDGATFEQGILTAP